MALLGQIPSDVLQNVPPRDPYLLYSALLTASQGTELLKQGTCFQPQGKAFGFSLSVLVSPSTSLRGEEKQNTEVMIC